VETGAIDSAQNVQALTEDFYFAKSQDGIGTTVDTLPGGQSLGELSDVNYFLSKLYKVLKLPKSRMGDSASSAQYSSGRNIEREEVKFGAFVERTQQRFEKLIMDILIQQLRIKKYDLKYIDRSIMDITFTKANFFKDFKEQELVEANLNLWTNAASYVVSVNNPTGEFSREFVMKKMLKMSDDMWNENEALRLKEQKEIKKVQLDQLNQQLKLDSITNDAQIEQELDNNAKLGETDINNTKETTDANGQ
jgi:hypothetical protein